MIILDVEDLRRVRQAVYDDGDPGNAQLLHSAGLRVAANLAGLPVYDSFAQRAAAFMDRLANDYPFDRGNLLTSAAAGLVLLRVNGYHLGRDADLVRELAEQLADPGCSIAELAVWLERHLETTEAGELGDAIDEVSDGFASVWEELAAADHD